MAAGSTYSQITTTTLGSNQTTVTLSSIPQIYTNLYFVISASNTAGNDNYLLYVNGDTATNYSATYLEADGSTAYSARWSNRANIPVARGASSTTGADQLNINFNQYNNTTTFKTVLARYSLGGTTGARTSETVGLWRSTAAINSISIICSAGAIATGSTFTLYGIKGA